MLRLLSFLLLFSLVACPAIRKASYGLRFVLLLDDAGGVWGVGDCTSGRLAQENCQYTAKPLRIPLPAPAKDIGATYEAGFAILESGQLYTWGNDAYGVTGRSPNFPENKRRLIFPSPAPVLENITQISTRGNTIAALNIDGTVFQWGSLNGKEVVASPQAISGLPPIASVDIGTSTIPIRIHTLALARDGSLWVWGNNNRGQLGIGNTTASATPVKLNLPPVVSIAACMDCSLAVLADGTVRAWGRDDSSITANGSNVQAAHFPSPVLVPGVAGAVSVAAGDGHAGVILKDGSIRTWGHDGWGQAGIGTNGGYQTRVARPKLTGVAKLFYCASSCFALTRDGRFYFWGVTSIRTAGALGQNRNVPTEIPEIW